MAYVSFKRTALAGEQPASINDGQFILDTNHGYLYSGVGSQAQPIIDRRDPIAFTTISELDTCTHNGWYYLVEDSEIEFETIQSGNITATAAWVNVNGTNETHLTQIAHIYTTSNIITLERHRFELSNDETTSVEWTGWNVKDTIVETAGENWKESPGGFYYFINAYIPEGETDTQYHCNPELYGHTYGPYSYFAMIVTEYPNVGKIITLYPIGDRSEILSFQITINSDNEPIGDWIVNNSNGILPIGKTQNLDEVVRTGLYTFNTKTEQTVSFCGITYNLKNYTLLEVKSNRTTKGVISHIIQTLHGPAANVLTLERHGSPDQDDDTKAVFGVWTAVDGKKGVSLTPQFADANKPTNAEREAFEATLQALPSGNYLIGTNKYHIHKDLLNKVLSSNEDLEYYPTSTCNLNVDRFHTEYAYHTLRFQINTAALADKYNLPKGTYLTLTRQQYNNTFTKWELDSVNNSNTIEMTNSPKASNILNRIEAKANLLTGSYLIKMKDKSVINDHEITYAIVRIERYGNQIRAFMYPVGTTWVLMVNCKLDSNGKAPNSAGWKWDESTCPKYSNREYPLADGTYYYKYTISRKKEKITRLKNQKDYPHVFQLFLNDPTKASLLPVVQCDSIPDDMKNADIKKINVLSTNGAILGYDPSITVRVIANTNSTLPLDEVIRLSTNNINNFNGKDEAGQYYYVTKGVITNETPVAKIDSTEVHNDIILSKTIKEAKWTTPKILLASTNKDTCQLDSANKATIEFYYTKG